MGWRVTERLAMAKRRKVGDDVVCDGRQSRGVRRSAEANENGERKET